MRATHIARAGAQGRGCRRRDRGRHVHASRRCGGAGGAYVRHARRRGVRHVARSARHRRGRVALGAGRRARMGPLGIAHAGILALVRRSRIAALRVSGAPARSGGHVAVAASGQHGARSDARAVGGDRRARTAHARAVRTDVAHSTSGQCSGHSGGHARDRSTGAGGHLRAVRCVLPTCARRAGAVDALPRDARPAARRRLAAARAADVDGGRRLHRYLVAPRAVRRARARARRAVAGSALRRTSAALDRRHVQAHGARRGAGARGGRADARLHAGVRHRAAIHGDGERGRPDRGAVSSRVGTASRRRSRREPPGPRSLRRRAVAARRRAGGMACVIAAARPRDRGAIAPFHPLRRWAAMDLERCLVLDPPSARRGLRRRVREDQRPLMRPAHRFRARQRAPHRRHRGAQRGTARRDRGRPLARRRPGRPSPRLADVVDARVRARRRAFHRRRRLRLPQPLRASARRHRRALHQHRHPGLAHGPRRCAHPRLRRPRSACARFPPARSAGAIGSTCRGAKGRIPADVATLGR